MDERLHPLFERLVRLRLLALREAQIAVLHAPFRHAAIDRKPGGFGNGNPGVALGGMEPATTQVEIEAIDLCGPRAAAQPRLRLDQHRREAAAPQMASRADPGSPATDDRHVALDTQKSFAPVISASFAINRSWNPGSSAAASGLRRSRWCQ